MYKIRYIKAINFLGFLSGLNTKRFELDLSTILDYDTIVILGDNGTGKSTLRSIIPPTTTPISKNKTFIAEGKEGLLIREYVRKDGFVIKTKCVYSPNNSGSHSTKAFFSISENDEDYKELNPTGNVTSYEALLESYFGLNKEGFKMTAYYDKAKGLVDMTPMERKSNISRFIPNTERLTAYYKIIDEKYKEVRNLLKNVSQKLGRFRDEETLERELRQVELYINKQIDLREQFLKTHIVHKSNVDRILDGRQMEDIEKSYKGSKRSISETRSIIEDSEIEHSILRKKLKVSESSRDLEVRIASSESGMRVFKSLIENKRNELYQIQEKLIELDAVLYSEENLDLDVLDFQLKELQDILNSLEYTKHAKYFENLYYGEAETLMNQLDTARDTILTLFSSHGDYVSQYFNKSGQFSKTRNISEFTEIVQEVSREIHEMTAKRNEIIIEINRLEGYRYLETQKNLRPKNCQIDTCPLLGEALNWDAYEKELEVKNRELSQFNKGYNLHLANFADLQGALDALKEITPLLNLIQSLDSQLKRYLNVRSSEIISELSRDIIHDCLSLNDIRTIMRILSEKDYYYDIINNLLPNVERQLHYAKMKKNEISSIESQHKSLKKTEKELTNQLTKLQIQVKVFKANIQYYSEQLEIRTKLEELDAVIKDSIQLEKELMSQLTDSESLLIELLESIDRSDKAKREIRDIDVDMQPLMVQRDKLKFEYQQVLQLKIEHDEVMNSFTILDALSRITKPGKGVWKRIINIYMQDIKDFANMLLEQTFDGNLQFNSFIISDDEFTIPFTNNGIMTKDISYASSSQASTMSSSLTLAIMAPMLDKYSILLFDEVDKDLSPKRKRKYISTLWQQLKVIGVCQSIIVTHSPEYYEPFSVGYVLFPGSDIPAGVDNYIVVGAA